MAVIKCKICGGSIELAADKTFGTCEYCGCTMTFPKIDDDQRAAAFNRGNEFRRIGEFDKALSIYERIVEEDDTDAEAHWCCVLCRFGIEYVEDPQTFEYLPTCHRASFDSVLEDPDYKAAIEYSEGVTKRQYMKDAARIAEVQKGILATSQNEEPFDVFISYKETDDAGNRTVDATLAQDIYYRLTEKGYRVFFSRITLEGKPGTEYEPYIFAALNSSKVMVLVGTSAENINSVWVKNEWSRFMAMRKKDKSKLLIPCYRDMDPYDLPEQISVLKAYDMSQIGFIQDLIRGISKVIDEDKPKETVKETVVVQQSTGNTTAAAQIKRGNMALEDHDWNKADSFFEEALNLDPECAEAYIGKLLARERKPGFDSWVAMQKEKYADAATERLEACPADEKHISEVANNYAIDGFLSKDNIRKQYDYDRGYNSSLSCRKSQKAKQQSELAEDRLLMRAKQYARGETLKQIENGLAEITAALDERISKAQNEDNASIARVKAAYAEHIAQADKKAEELNADARAQQERRYQEAVALMKKAGDVPAYNAAYDALKAMNGYKDSSNLAAQCQKEVERLNEEKRLEEERQETIRKEKAELAAKKRKKLITVLAAAAAVCIAVILIVTKVIIPNSNYKAAVALMDNGDYIAAYEALDNLDGYKDSAELKASIDYQTALLNAAEVGDSVYYGAYEQDNDTSNGKEDIEWIVLDKDGANILVISKYALDCQQYNTSYTGVTWATCSLRSWLNGTFLKDAFTDAEQACIPTVTVTTYNNSKYNTDAGNDTQDQVFLLSIAEAEKYFASDEERMCVPTAYAVAQGAWTNDDYTVGGAATCWWWLRSPGNYCTRAADVFDDGSIDYYGYNVYVSDDCIRPALWINLNVSSETSEKNENTELDNSNLSQEAYSFKDSKIGDTILFGSYEQDNDTSNGKENIEWTVLNKENGRILVISKCALDCQQYNTDYTDITWETCSLRNWLNGAFLKDAFTDEEQKYIPTVTVTADKNPKYSTEAGNDTQDQVFLLSIAEAEKYFASDEDRMCVPTTYTVVQGASTYKEDGATTCYWFLRSPGSRSDYAAGVYSDGSFHCSGGSVAYNTIGVRPAMWINLES